MPRESESKREIEGRRREGENGEEKERKGGER